MTLNIGHYIIEHRLLGNAGDAAGNAGDDAGNAGDAAGNAGDAAGNAGDTVGKEYLLRLHRMLFVGTWPCWSTGTLCNSSGDCFDTEAPLIYTAVSWGCIA